MNLTVLVDLPMGAMLEPVNCGALSFGGQFSAGGGGWFCSRSMKSSISGTKAIGWIHVSMWNEGSLPSWQALQPSISGADSG